MSLSPVGMFMSKRMHYLGIDSVKDLARRSGIAQTTLYRIRNHEFAIQDKTLERLAKTLKCEIYEIKAIAPEDTRVITRRRDVVPADFQKQQTICWNCQNAVPDGSLGCNWSRELEPVDGWEAIETFTAHYEGGKRRDVRSALVIRCPEFIPDVIGE